MVATLEVLCSIPAGAKKNLQAVCILDGTTTPARPAHARAEFPLKSGSPLGSGDPGYTLRDRVCVYRVGVIAPLGQAISSRTNVFCCRIVSANKRRG